MFYSFFAIAESSKLCIYSDTSSKDLCPSDYDNKPVGDLNSMSSSVFKNYDKVFIAGNISISTTGTFNDTLMDLDITQCNTEFAEGSCNYEFADNSKLTLKFAYEEFNGLEIFGNSENFDFQMDSKVKFEKISLSGDIVTKFKDNFEFKDSLTNLSIMMKLTDQVKDYDWTSIGEKDISIELTNEEDNKTRVHVNVNPNEKILISNYTISVKTKRTTIKLTEHQPLQIEQSNLDASHSLTVGTPGVKGVFIHLNDSFVNLTEKSLDVLPSNPNHVIFYISNQKIPFFINSSNMTVEVRPPIPEFIKGSKTAAIIAIVVPLAMILAIIIVEIILIVKDKRNAITDSTYKKVF